MNVNEREAITQPKYKTFADMPDEVLEKFLASLHKVSQKAAKKIRRKP